jgi:signal transduction histidine kinase
VLPSDRAALSALLAGARGAPGDRPTDAFVRVRHDARGGTRTALEVKACADVDGRGLVYCVLLDARVPARLEGLLPDFLLSTSHDLRTPACSIQSASSLLAAFPAVAADAEACALLHGVDAACAVLLRSVTNVLSLRMLQRNGALPLAPPKPTELRACVARSVALVCGFLGDPPRVAWAESALPASVLVDAPALEACIQNVLLAAVRLGAFVQSRGPVRLSVATQYAPPRADSVELNISAKRTQPGSDEHVTVTEEYPNTFLLLITADTPGRPLSRDEIERMLAPCGMVPADKGGGTGLALYIARGIARALGGDLEVESDREEGTHISLCIPLAKAKWGMLPPPSPAPPPAETAAEALAADEDAPQCTPAVDELALTTSMFTSLLTNSADVFAICRITPGEAVEQGAPPPLITNVEYVSPAASRGVAFCTQLHVGQALHEVCVPEERRAFDAAVERAYRGSASDAGADDAGLLFFVHRCVTPSGGSAWCHTSGVVDGDQLLLVCRDVRARKSVELALRAFALATTHDVRECCNAVLVATALLERRPCAAAGATSSPPAASSSTAAACAAPLDAHFLVSCIRAACGLILGIVGNVLTAPEVERGALTLTRDTFSPRDVICDVLQACRLGYAAATAAGGSIVLEEGEETDADAGEGMDAGISLTTQSLVEADRNRIAQVTQNLVRARCLQALVACFRLRSQMNADLSRDR